MSAKLTPGRAIAKQRASVMGKVRRLIKRYDLPSVTDTDIKAVLDEVLAFLATAPDRYNAKAGGLGK